MSKSYQNISNYEKEILEMKAQVNAGFSLAHRKEVKPSVNIK